MRAFWPEIGVFWQKSGQNQGSAVTDSLTLPKCKVLIPCKLQGIYGPQKRFPQDKSSFFWFLGRGKREKVTGNRG
jgi:hypothetical protein